MISAKDSIEIITLISLIVAATWRIAKLEYAIYKAIQNSEKSLSEQISNHNTRFLVHQAETDAFSTRMQLIVEELEHRVEVKLTHLGENQRQILGFLQKTSGFIPRDREME